MVKKEMINMNQEQEPLNLLDLLDDEKADEISEYLSISIENLGEDTRVSVTTVEETPVTYSSTITGVSFDGLEYLVADDEMDSI